MTRRNFIKTVGVGIPAGIIGLNITKPKVVKPIVGLDLAGLDTFDKTVMCTQRLLSIKHLGTTDVDILKKYLKSRRAFKRNKLSNLT